ncbi:MAG: hypothetical protein OXC45_05600, partial [Gemmatimonadetes bacterium]|nr:hypothetical protein [Gemmatimonadota bacterium]
RSSWALVFTWAKIIANTAIYLKRIIRISILLQMRWLLLLQGLDEKTLKKLPSICLLCHKKLQVFKKMESCQKSIGKK